jgi:hypothetical protein
MKCPNCQWEQPDTATLCSLCGQVFMKAAPPKPAPAKPVTPTPAKTAAPPKLSLSTGKPISSTAPKPAAPSGAKVEKADSDSPKLPQSVMPPSEAARYKFKYYHYLGIAAMIALPVLYFSIPSAEEPARPALAPLDTPPQPVVTETAPVPTDTPVPVEAPIQFEPIEQAPAPAPTSLPAKPNPAPPGGMY